MMRTCVRAGRIQTPEVSCVRTHVRIKTAKKSYMQNGNPLKNGSRLLPLCYALGMRKTLYYKHIRKQIYTVLRVGDQSIVPVKNRILTGKKNGKSSQTEESLQFLLL